MRGGVRAPCGDLSGDTGGLVVVVSPVGGWGRDVCGRGEPWSAALASAEGLFEHGAVGVFDLGAWREAAGEAGDVDAGIGECFGDVEGCGVAFGGGVGCEYDFVDVGFADAFEQGVDGEVFGFDSFERGDAAHEDVVGTVDEACVFEVEEVFGLFDDDDLRLVSAVVAADVAEFLVGDVEASGAGADFFLCGADGIGKGEGFLATGLEDVEGDSFGGASADAWQFFELFDEFLEWTCGCGGVGHG